MEKITVSEYLKNNDLLEEVYTPYETKKDVCEIIISQVIRKDGIYYELDSVLLERVKAQVIIETITNLDMSSDDDETGLSGYDMLCYLNKLEELETLLGVEYERFTHIIDIMVEEFYKNQGSIRGLVFGLKNEISVKLISFKEEIDMFIQNIDVKDVADKLSVIIKNASR